MINTLTRKHKGGPKEPKVSKFDLILKRLDTVDAFIKEQRKFNQNIDYRLNKVENTLENVVQRVNFVDDKLNRVITKNNLKV